MGCRLLSTGPRLRGIGGLLRRPSRCAPAGDQARHDHRSTIVLGDVLEQDRITPGRGRLVLRVEFSVSLAADRGQDALKRNDFEREFDRRDVFDTMTTDYFTPPPGNYLPPHIPTHLAYP